MVRRVQAGKLCGTVAGLPWPQDSRGEGKSGEGGRGDDQQIQWALMRKGWLQRVSIVLLGRILVLSYQRDVTSVGYMYRTFMS